MDSDVALIDVETNEVGVFCQDTFIDIDSCIVNQIEEDIVPTFILPEDKDRHLFVSYSAEDSEIVWPIVDAIERRYNLKCVYADRDFQPGMDISENIRIGMQRSWKVLIMLSPNFMQSGWCKYEREFAFVQSVETGINRIIPVLLEDCQLPTTLVTLTYINAAEPFCDVAEKVLQAMNNPDGILPTDDSAKYENGYIVSILAKREPLCYCRPANYTFELDQSHLEEMKRVKINIPGQVLENYINILNKRKALRFYDCLESPRRWCCWVLFVVLFVVIGIPIASCTPLLNKSRFSDVKKYYEESYNTAPCIVSPAIILCALGILLTACFAWPIFSTCFSAKIARNVHRTMWKELSKTFLKYNTILMYLHPKFQAPTLSIMRYDISKCQEYIYRKLQSNQETWSGNEMEAKEHAFGLIDRYLFAVSPDMAYNFDSLPTAPYKRHCVMKGRACICQCIEQWQWI